MIRGVIPALLTPFDKNGEVAEVQLAAYVDWIISKGVHGLFPCGTTGEGPLMTPIQRMAAAEKVLEAARGRVPVVVHTGAISTEEAIALTRHAQFYGAAGAAVVAPWYYALDDQSLLAHFSAVAEAVPGFPLYLYNIPANAKNSISPALAAALTDRYPHLAGIKDSSKSMASMRAYRAALPGRSVIVGSDEIFAEALGAGGDGIVTAVGACFPELLVGLWDAFHAGRGSAVVELQARILGVRDALKQGPYGNPYKLALAWRGLEFGGMRAPLREATPAEAAAVRSALDKLGVLA